GNRGCDEHRIDTAAVEVRTPDPVAVGPARRPVDVSAVDCQRVGKNAQDEALIDDPGTVHPHAPDRPTPCNKVEVGAVDRHRLRSVESADERYVYRAAVEMVGPPDGIARTLRPIDEGIGAADETGSGERRKDERSRAHEQRLKIERTCDS